MNGYPNNPGFKSAVRAAMLSRRKNASGMSAVAVRWLGPVEDAS